MGITKIKKKKNYKQQERVSWYLEFFQAGTFIITKTHSLNKLEDSMITKEQ